jgi:hypothetical protein
VVELAPDPLELAANGQLCSVRVDIIPDEAQHLTAPEPEREHQHVPSSTYLPSSRHSLTSVDRAAWAMMLLRRVDFPPPGRPEACR